MVIDFELLAPKLRPTHPAEGLPKPVGSHSRLIPPEQPGKAGVAVCEKDRRGHHHRLQPPYPRTFPGPHETPAYLLQEHHLHHPHPSGPAQLSRSPRRKRERERAEEHGRPAHRDQGGQVRQPVPQHDRKGPDVKSGSADNFGPVLLRSPYGQSGGPPLLLTIRPGQPSIPNFLFPCSLFLPLFIMVQSFPVQR